MLINSFSKKRQEGFTFIEIMVTIAIIGIIATVIITNVAGVKQRGRDGKRKSDLALVQAAIEQYKADYEQYPCFNVNSDCTTSEWWARISTIGSNNLPKKYISNIPDDPLYGNVSCDSNHPGYLYWHSATRQQYALFANLENPNDSDAVAVKPQPPNQTMGNCSGTGGSCTQFTITNAAIGSCVGATFNYWVTNP